MIRFLAEAMVFTGLAVALHLGGLTLAGQGAGAPDARGTGGADLVSLRGADGALAATVAEWTRAPRAQDRATPPKTAPTPDHPPAATGATDTSPAERAATPSLPKADTPLLPRLPAPAIPRPDVALPPATPVPVAVPDAVATMRGALGPHRDEPRTPAPLAQPGQAPALPEIMPEVASSPKPHAPRSPVLRPAVPRPAAAAPALRAAGQGGGAAAGASGRADTPALSPGDRNSLLAAWGARIRGAVERQKHYPRAAGGATGTATVQISVIGDGRVKRAVLRQSAGHPALDHAALAAVRAAGRFPTAPGALGPGPHDFSFQMSFDR